MTTGSEILQLIFHHAGRKRAIVETEPIVHDDRLGTLVVQPKFHVVTQVAGHHGESHGVCNVGKENGRRPHDAAVGEVGAVKIKIDVRRDGVRRQRGGNGVETEAVKRTVALRAERVCTDRIEHEQARGGREFDAGGHNQPQFETTVHDIDVSFKERIRVVSVGQRRDARATITFTFYRLGRREERAGQRSVEIGVHLGTSILSSDKSTESHFPTRFKCGEG